jgi:hypothetical protein
MDKSQALMPKTSLGLMLGVSLIPLIASLFWLTGSTTYEINQRDLIYIFLSAVILLVAESAFVSVVFLVGRRFKDTHIVRTVLSVSSALLGALNVKYCLLQLLDVSSLVRLVATIGMFLVLFLIVRFPASRLPSVIFAVVLAALPWFQHESDKAGLSSEQTRSLSNTISKNVKKDRPLKGPVYLIGFDALLSKAAFNRLLGLPGEPVWNDTLNSLGFNVVADAIAAGNATRPSFHNLLNLGTGINVEDPGKFFTRVEMNPAYKAFDDAGYQVQFLSGTSYFGTGIGKTIEHFYPTELSGFCNFIPQSFGILMCRKPVRKFVRKLMGESIDQSDLESHFLERIEVNQKQSNWVTFAYILSPGHTPAYGEYRHDNLEARKKYTSVFQIKSTETSSHITKIVSSILYRQPKAIIIVFGDHGAWITRGAEDGKSPYTQKDIELDQFGITFASYPSEFCSEHFVQGYRAERLVPDLLECLKANK